MKKAIYLLLFFVSIQTQAQNYYGNSSPFIYNNWQLYSKNSIPDHLKRVIKEIKITTASKKANSVFTEKFDTNGRIISSKFEGKNISNSEVVYNEKNFPISYKQVRNGKISYESTATFDDQFRMLEKTTRGKKGKIKKRSVMSYGEGDCPLTTENYYKNKNYYTSRWVNTYYSECDKKSTVLYNKKGKIQKTWTYDCKKEGELLIPKKDVTQVCKWDEETEKYFIKVFQDFDEKGKIRKRVEKFNKADTSLAENAFYGEEGLITYRFTQTYDSENNKRTTVSENLKKGESSSISTSVFQDKNKLSMEIYRKGKLSYQEINTYDGNNRIKHETFNKKGPLKRTINTYENENLTSSKTTKKGKLTESSQIQYNEKGLPTKKEVFSGKGELESTALYEYVD